jgi:hypothetical protein
MSALSLGNRADWPAAGGRHRRRTQCRLTRVRPEKARIEGALACDVSSRDAKLSLLLIVEATNAVRVGPREAKSLFLIPQRHHDEVAVRRGS